MQETKEFYGEYTYNQLKSVESQLVDLVQHYCDKQKENGVKYISSRIKAYDSLEEKLKRKGFDITPESALKKIHDAVGVRVVCLFLSDVYQFREWLRTIDDVTILVEKDYIKNPKENGYRSIHFQVEINKGQNAGLYAEIQVRSIAMDFWAAMEHEIQYKKIIKNGEKFTAELKACAEEAADLDVRMQRLKNEVEKVDPADITVFAMG